MTGTFVTRYLLEDGTYITQPADLSQTPVLALFQVGGNQWGAYTGTGKADGTFSIAMPDIPYVLSVEQSMLYTSARQIDLDGDALGRPDAVYPMDGMSVLAGNIGGMGAWAASDRIEAHCFDSQGFAEYFSMASPNVGDTSLTGQPLDWFGGLVDASKGDVLYFTQLEAGPGGAYDLVTHAATFPNVEMTLGVPTTVNGTFAAVAPSESATLDFRASEFAAQVQAVNPLATDGGSELTIGTSPGAATDGILGSSATLLILGVAGVDTNLGTVSYGNPFPSAWGETLQAVESVTLDYTVPGASQPATAFAGISVVMPPSAAAAGPIQPLVTPVQSPTIDGQDAFGKLSGISLTPTLAWKAPAVGTPAGYQVSLYQLQAYSGIGVNNLVMTLVTTDTTMPIPSDVLSQGSSYYFQITAVVSPVDFMSHPTGQSPTSAWADALTSSFSL